MTIVSNYMRQTGASARRLMLGVLLPAGACVVCGSPAYAADGVCADCVETLRRFIIIPTGCPVCGATNDGSVCPSCIGKFSDILKMRCAYRYKGVTRALIHQLKFHGNPQIASPLFAPALSRNLADLMPDADCIIPVPLSRGRMLERGYNQSAFLANGVSELCKIPVREDLLYRNRETQRQSELALEARDGNVSGAFTALPCAGLRVALLDDVATTCGTILACSKALRLAGAREICVLAAARA